MLILANYDYKRPASLSEAVSLLARPGSSLMAGGSDVMPSLKHRLIDPELMIDLAKIPELHALEQRENGIHIGSMCTLAELSENEMVQALLPALAQAAANVASPQIRNRGTIGGNVLQSRRCFYYNQAAEWRQGIPRCYKVGGDRCIQISNSPVCRAIYYSDLAPALLAYGASAVVVDASGEKVIPCSELIAAHTSDSLPPLIIREFIVPVCRGWSGFTKYALRHSIDFPIINFALCMGDSIRLFAGAIAPNVVELSETAEYLSAHPDFGVEEASALAVAEMQRKCALIREAGLSVPVKRSAFAMVREIFEAYHSANT